MELLEDTAVAVFVVLGMVQLVFNIVVPYYIYRIHCDNFEIKEMINNLQMAQPVPSEHLDKEEEKTKYTKWQKNRFYKPKI